MKDYQTLKKIEQLEREIEELQAMISAYNSDLDKGYEKLKDCDFSAGKVDEFSKHLKDIKKNIKSCERKIKFRIQKKEDLS